MSRRTTMTAEERQAKTEARKEARARRVASFWDVVKEWDTALNAAVRTKTVRTEETAFRSIALICSEMEEVLLNPNNSLGQPQIVVTHDYMRNRAIITFASELMEEGEVFKVVVKETGYDHFGDRLPTGLVETEIALEYNGAFWSLIGKIEDALGSSRFGF